MRWARRPSRKPMPRATPTSEPRMTPLPEGALAALAHRSQVLLCLDYDGTIAEIVEDPARATPHPDAPSLLRRIAARPDRAALAIVSGREISVLRRFLGIDEDLILVGVHGLQILWPDGTREMNAGASRADLARLRAWVSANVPSGSGFRVEDKEFSIALHYRCAPAENAGRVCDAFAEFVKNNTPALTLSPGKCVIEALPRIAGKSHAVRALRRRSFGRRRFRRDRRRGFLDLRRTRTDERGALPGRFAARRHPSADRACDRHGITSSSRKPRIDHPCAPL